jgi:hypothetical protein
MNQELLKFQGWLGNVALLEYPQGSYEVEAYWRPGDCRRTLIETQDLALAKTVYLRTMENL